MPVQLLKIAVAAGTLSVFVALALWPVFLIFLNPKFDPDWKDRRWTPFEREALPFFGVFRIALYVPAVASRFCARRLFGVPEGERYDFRGRAGPVLYALCMVEMILMYGGLSISLVAYYWLKLIA